MLIGSHGCQIEWYYFRWSLSDPWLGFQGHSILTSRISQKRCVLWTKLLKNTNRKPYPVYKLVLLSITLSDLWSQFQSHNNFWHWISQKWHQIRAIVTIEHQQEVVCTLLNVDISNDLDGPLTRFWMSRHFWSRISQKRCVLGTKFL